MVFSMNALTDIHHPTRMPDGYAEWLVDVKARVRATQFRAAQAANVEVIRLYWSIGRDILDRQETLGWGAKVIDQLAADLHREFPDQKGWSPTNLNYMRMMARAWPTPNAISPQPVEKLPWGHIRLLLDRLKTREERDWYAAQALTEGWSRPVLGFQIDSDVRGRLGSAPSNFEQVLTPPDSDLAQAMIKDPLIFQHLGLVKPATEHAVEEALMNRRGTSGRCGR